MEVSFTFLVIFIILIAVNKWPLLIIVLIGIDVLMFDTEIGRAHRVADDCENAGGQAEQTARQQWLRAEHTATGGHRPRACVTRVHVLVQSRVDFVYCTLRPHERTTATACLPFTVHHLCATHGLHSMLVVPPHAHLLHKYQR